MKVCDTRRFLGQICIITETRLTLHYTYVHVLCYVWHMHTVVYSLTYKTDNDLLSGEFYSCGKSRKVVFQLDTIFIHLLLVSFYLKNITNKCSRNCLPYCIKIQLSVNFTVRWTFPYELLTTYIKICCD